MVLTSAAKKIKFSDKIRDACDFDFGLRLASTYSKFYFSNKYTSKYRSTDIAVSKKEDNIAALETYLLLKSLKLSNILNLFRKEAMIKLAPIIISYYAKNQEKKKALKIYFSEYYPIKKRFGLHGIYYLFLILSPNFIIKKVISFVSLIKKI